MISMKGGGGVVRVRGGGREGAGRSAIAARADDPAAKKKVDYSNAWPEARALVLAHKGRLAIGLLLMLVNRLSGLVLPASSKYLIDDVIGKRHTEMLVPLALAAGVATLVQAGTSFGVSPGLGGAAPRAHTDMRRPREAPGARPPRPYFYSTQTGG